MEPSAEKKTQPRWYKWLPAITILFILLVGSIYSIVVLNQENIYHHIYIDSIPVGGLSKEEAVEKVQLALDEFNQNSQISFYYEEASWQYTYANLGNEFELEEAIEEAYGVGRDGNFLQRLETLLSLVNEPYLITVKADFNETRLEAVLDELGQGVRQESANAQLQRINGKFVIIDERLGIELDREALKQRMQRAVASYDHSPIELPVEYVKPKITEQVLNQLEGPIGSFTTTFNAGVSGRSANISLASKSIDGMLLMPGEALSFNTQTGPRGVKEGYQEAPIIVNGQLVPGIGGGICQVSTTLYNAVVRANLEIIERRNHSLPVAYVPLGHDATVAYGYIDFQFMNDQSYPIYVESFVKEDKITVTLYGKQEQSHTIQLVSQVVETIEPKVEIKEDNTLYRDEFRVEKEPKTGYRVKTYKVYLENGKEVNRELISSDYYIPVHGVRVQGTKEREASSEEIDTENVPVESPVP